MAACRVCGNGNGNREHAARELFLGFGDVFRYSECGRCESLSLVDVPEDLGQYYSGGYYSLVPESRLRRKLKAVRFRHAYGSRSLLGAVLTRVFGPADISWLTSVDVGLHEPILDVGCGSGEILRHLAALGFRDLTGVDPYAREDGEPRILRGNERDAPRRDYKLVMMHHSLEHCVEPLDVLKTLRSLVAKEGYVLIRIPLAGKLAWRTYGVAWFQLDAPRHICLFSERAFRAAAGECGFAIESTRYDSAPTQFYASELYARGIPQIRHRRPRGRERMRYVRLTDAANHSGDADQACFVMRPS